MTEIVTEALIEMHFHSALVQKFQTDYGANFLKLLKPSPQQEAWVPLFFVNCVGLTPMSSAAAVLFAVG